MSLDATETIHTLRIHQALCQELLLLVEQETQDLHSQTPSLPANTAPNDPNQASSNAYDFYQRRKKLLPKLDASLLEIKRKRAWWQRLPPDQRRRHQEIDPLIRATQDLIMKIVFLDRENEKSRLRLGLLPAGQLPPARSHQPHYVTQLYRRHSPPNP
jgi:hypothetical protein